MAKRKPDARRDAEKFKDLLETYRDGGKVAAIIFLDDGKAKGTLMSGNCAKILGLCARGVADLICRIEKDESRATDLSEKISALIPAFVRSNFADTSVLDALMATVGADEDKDDD